MYVTMIEGNQEVSKNNVILLSKGHTGFSVKNTGVMAKQSLGNTELQMSNNKK